MSKSKLKTRIKRFVKSELCDYGFSLVKPTTIERSVDGMIQGINFQSGTSYLTGKYTMNVYWRFNYHERDYIAFDGCQRIGQLTEGKDLWLTFEGELFEDDFLKAKGLILEKAIPYLDENSSLSKLLDGIEIGRITKSDAFGPDVGWQYFNAGFSFAAVGRKNEALRELEELVASHSQSPLSFVQDRKKLAQNQMIELTAK